MSASEAALAPCYRWGTGPTLSASERFLQLSFKLQFMCKYMILSGKEAKFDHKFYDNIRDVTLRVLTLTEFFSTRNIENGWYFNFL